MHCLSLCSLRMRAESDEHPYMLYLDGAVVQRSVQGGIRILTCIHVETFV